MCPICDNVHNQKVKEDNNYFVKGMKIHGVTYTYCDACGEEYMSANQARQADLLVIEQTR